MNHPLGYYKPSFIMRSKDIGSLRILDLWTFRSAKSNKRYIVEVENFDNEFYGIKFYWKGVEKSSNRYSMLTNDFEPRTIIRSCVEVMLKYYFKNPQASFGFVAAPDLEPDIRGKKINADSGSRRFRFYRRMMVNLFGPETFYQVSDTSNTIYLLVNKQRLDSGAISFKAIETYINRMYIGDYIVDE